MKHAFWLGLLAILFTHSLHAQNIAGTWQGVEDPGSPEHYCPSVLRLQTSAGGAVFGVLYQEAGMRPHVTVNFQMEGLRSGNMLKLNHGRKLNETGRSPYTYWCDGSVTFTYNATLERLTGHASYRAVGNCDTGMFVLYRVKLKSAAQVPANVASALRVSGRDVQWFADAECTQPVAKGNVYRAKLGKTTTFYLTQGYYPSAEKVVTPVIITVAPPKRSPASATPPPPVPRPTPPTSRPPVAATSRPPAATGPRPVPRPTPADTLPKLPGISRTRPPMVLPTVLFKQGTPELLPQSSPALDKLAAALQAAPALRLRVAGHTDRLGEAGKNQVLSEQRAAAVKDYLVRAGIDASRLETVGYGDTRPLYASPDIRNRRVEVESL